MIYRFGEYRVDVERLELRRGSEVLEVQPKVLDLLLLLIRERERVVSRSELLDRLWADAAVVEGVLTTAIHEARAALDDRADRQWAIKTVARRGYRFVAPVEEETDVARVEDRAPLEDPWTSDAFVGRRDCLFRLESALDAAASGRGRVIVITGESGIGKTRLMDEFASRATPRGTRVLAGWCYQGEGSPPYWPWTPVLRGAIADASPEDALLDMGAGAADLAALVPALHELRSDLPEPPRLQSGPARFRLFESIAGFLANTAKRRPLLILIDDLQSADHASLRLLSFVAREVRRARILMVVTLREGEGEGDADGVLVETLAELARQFPGERMHLEGLSVPETGQLVGCLTSTEASPAVTRAIAEWSEGNPFFAKEIVGLLQSQGRLQEEPGPGPLWSAVPPGVRDVIRQRLHRRSTICQRLMALAAVLGREFRRDLLGKVASIGPEELSRGLDEACAANFIQEHPTRAGHYRFTHVLTRQTLYGEWSASGRASWHRRTGEALEELAAAGAGAAPAELAHHFLKASEDGEVAKAIDYAVRAAEQAISLHAHDEAVKHYGRAVKALEVSGPPDDARRCELLIGLGTAQLDARRSDPDGRASLLDAARIAQGLREPDKLARAALELAGTAHQAGPGDPVVIELLEGALAELHGDDSLKARVLADLAVQRLTAATFDECFALSEEAVALARKSGDALAVGDTLNLRCILLSGPDHVRERLFHADSLLELAGETGSAELALFGRRWRLVSMLELGETAALDRELAAYERAAEEARAWTARWYALTLRATRAFAEGRLDDAEHMALDAFSQRREEPTELTIYTFGSQLAWLRREQGRFGELAPYAQAPPSGSRFPLLSAFRATMALLDAEYSLPEAAQAELDRFKAERLADLPRDFTYLYSLAVLSELCSTLGDSAGAAIVYDALHPFADRQVILFVGTVSLGSAERYLGQLSATMQQWDRAEAHFEAAVEANLRQGARLWVAHTQLDWAAMLQAQGQDTDGKFARELLRSCLATAGELGLTSIETKAAALAAELG